MTLTGRFFALYGFLQLVSLLGLIFPFALWFALGMTALLISLVLWDRRTLAVQGDFTLDLSAPASPSLDQETELKIAWHARNSRALSQREISVLVPPLELFSFDETKWTFSPSSFKEPSATHSLKACVRRLGYLRVEKWPMTTLSTLGFFRRTFEIPIEPVELRAGPERTNLGEQAFIEILQSQRALSRGARLQARARSADLFYSVRKYQYPDSIRHIDQKKSARFGELMTRIFEEHHSHHLVIAFDTGRAMSGEIQGSRKVDYYISAALALAENAVRSQDHVSLFAFSRSVHTSVRKTRTLSGFRSLYRAAEEFSPRDEETDYSLLPRVISQLAGSRSIVVVLTDLSKPSVQEALLESLAPVCRTHLVLALSLNDREIDLEDRVLNFVREEKGGEPTTTDFADHYADLLYSYWAKERHLLFREKLSRLGGSSLVIKDKDWMGAVSGVYGLLRNS